MQHKRMKNVFDKFRFIIADILELEAVPQLGFEMVLLR